MGEQLWRIRGNTDTCSDDLAENWHWLKDDLATLIDYGVLVPVADGALLIEDGLEAAVERMVRYFCIKFPETTRTPDDLALLREDCIEALTAAVGGQPPL